MASALSAEVAAFQNSIKAPRPFAAVSDLIADAPGKTAVYANPLKDDGKKPLSFEALKSFCSSFDLSQFGIGRDKVVCTAIPNGPEAAVCFWSISKHCVFAPLNPGLTVPEVEFELTDLPCHTMILMDNDKSNAAEGIISACATNNVSVLRLVPDKQTVGLFTLVPQGPVTAVAPTQVAASDVALVLHTSGTTKKPKIVPLTHSNLGHGIQFVEATLQRQPNHICLNIMPLFHIHGIVANVGVSACNGTPVIASAFMGGDEFLQQLATKGLRPTWYSAVPTMHEAILLEAEKRGKSLDHSLTLMRNCSAALLPPVSKRFLKAFGTDLNQPFTVVPTYAMTESFPICSNPPTHEIRLSTVGPAMGPTIKILAGHPNDEEVPPGTEGEVCVTGPCVTAGYLMRPHMEQDPNIEAFSKAASPVGRMLRTGDKGYLDASGYLQLVGRFKEIINVGGEKVSPLDMEDQILSVAGVETCVCFATPAELLGEVVAVACVPKAGEAYPTLASIREGLPGTLPRFKPRVLVIMDQIPKGPTGKPKRIGLAKMLCIPAIGTAAPDVTYRVEGKGDDLKELTRLGEKGVYVPVWTFPLTMTLIMNPDMTPPDITKHTLTIEESLCHEFKLTVSGRLKDKDESAPEIPVEWPIPSEEVKEALAYMDMHTEERGMKWVAKCGERGRHEDWCGEVKMKDATKELSHYWPNGCSDVPPGKLLRLLKVLEIAIPVDGSLAVGAHLKEDSPWYQKALEQGLVGSVSPRPTGAVGAS